jgi:hypothetical protein
MIVAIVVVAAETLRRRDINPLAIKFLKLTRSCQLFFAMYSVSQGTGLKIER